MSSEQVRGRLPSGSPPPPLRPARGSGGGPGAPVPSAGTAGTAGRRSPEPQCPAGEGRFPQPLPFQVPAQAGRPGSRHDNQARQPRGAPRRCPPRAPGRRAGRGRQSMATTTPFPGFLGSSQAVQTSLRARWPVVELKSHVAVVTLKKRTLELTSHCEKRKCRTIIN